jgi:hypothetical protein
VVPDLDDPAVAQRVAAKLAAAEATEAAAWARRGLRLVRRRDGMVGITGHLDPLAGAPEVWCGRCWRPPPARSTPSTGVRDGRSGEQWLADALVEAVTTTSPLDLDDDPGLTRAAGADQRANEDAVGRRRHRRHGRRGRRGDAGDAGDDPDGDAVDLVDNIDDLNDVGDAGHGGGGRW